ncbi:heavy-metal-associated domain-containing protein [Candidatus Marinarcus aquaticus]|uniref:Heavy metal transporter n=1 Tax=Candidatus Marinarcus aquaticus TaxID=2044504 RepID=A0A4Q0XRY1_9BACT|nr:heavy metal transporter [Candidatus Marinarcus aquaticus]RXJ60230.1 heavy metal transporter [Candidatus Marinarcus aquaticus]
MKQTFEVLNVKCGGCAKTLIKGLNEEFGDVEVNLDVHPRQIRLEMEENQMEDLKLKLRKMGYPLISDELSGFEKATTTAKSFVSCAIGRMNS